MEVPSLARGEDKQPIAAPEPLCMTLRTGDVQVNGPKASISSALHHLAGLQCQNCCPLTFIFNSQRVTPEICVTLKSLPSPSEMTFVRDTATPKLHIMATRQEPSTTKVHLQNLVYCWTIWNNLTCSFSKRQSAEYINSIWIWVPPVGGVWYMMTVSFFSATYLFLFSLRQKSTQQYL